MRKTQTHERRVANIYDDVFTPLVPRGGKFIGEHIVQLDDSVPRATGFHVYRMDPGMTTIPHEHTCNEQFLVLEGDITDNDGYEYRPGDLVLLKTGTQHCSTTKDGCTLAVFIATAEHNLDTAE